MTMQPKPALGIILMMWALFAGAVAVGILIAAGPAYLFNIPAMALALYLATSRSAANRMNGYACLALEAVAIVTAMLTGRI